MWDKSQPLLMAVATMTIAAGAWVFATTPAKIDDIKERVVRLEEADKSQDRTNAIQDQQISALEEAVDVMKKSVGENNFNLKYLKDRWDKWEEYDRSRLKQPTSY